MSNVPPYQPMPPPANPNDQRGTYVLIAGILSLVLCCAVPGIYAIVVGNKMKKEYGGTIPSPGNIGFILGIIGTVLTVLFYVFYLFIIVLAVGSSTTVTY